MNVPAERSSVQQLERPPVLHEKGSLLPLVGRTALLDLQRGEIVVHDKLEVPLNEHAIPQPVELIQNVLETVEGRHFWSGIYDVHHIAWPGCDYRALNDGTNLLGSLYRGSGSLKILMPRQLHNYIHAVTEPPKMPEWDVMEQWVRESEQVGRLYNTIRLSNFAKADISEEQKEHYRFSNFQQKLENMEDGHLGVMPDREYLAGLEVGSARQVLRSIARVRGFSNTRRQQQRFLRAA